MWLKSEVLAPWASIIWATRPTLVPDAVASSASLAALLLWGQTKDEWRPPAPSEIELQPPPKRHFNKTRRRLLLLITALNDSSFNRDQTSYEQLDKRTSFRLTLNQKNFCEWANESKMIRTSVWLLRKSKKTYFSINSIGPQCLC